MDDKTDAFDLRYHLRVDEVFSTVDGNVGISFCRVDSNTQYFVEYNTVSKYVQLRKFVNGAPTVLFNKKMTLDTGKWYQFGLTYENGHIRFYLDGELIIDHKDSSPLGAAILTLAGYNTAMSLDNVTLSESGTLDMAQKLPLKAEIYAVTFNGAGGSSLPAPQVLRKGDGLNLKAIPTPVREGYTFKGWADAEGNAVDLSAFVMPAADVVLTAVWEADETVTDPTESDTAEPDTEPDTEPGTELVTDPDPGTDSAPAPDTDSTTTPVTATPGDSGCRSGIAAGIVPLLLLLATCCVAIRKRKES
jgi:uncharacterized repeat protein (TIGR02543 family)